MKLSTPFGYTLITACLLFALGVLGFAFRTSFDLPDKYLFGSLLLGFWGLVVAASSGQR